MSCLLTQLMSCLQTQQMSCLQTQQMSCLQTQQVCLLQHKTHILVLKRDPCFRVVADGLVMGGLGMCQGVVWTCSYKGFAGFGKGAHHILLIMGEFGRGAMLDEQL